MSTDDDDRNPLEQALDVLVYLPVGMLLDFPRSVPRYIDRGRRQFAVTRQVGQRAFNRPSLDPVHHLDRVQEKTQKTLRALGLAPAADPPVAPNGSKPRGADRPASASGPDVAAAVGAGPSAVSRPAPASSGIDPDTLAIPDYDSLSASQVVPRLDSLATDELETIRLYEQGGRGRKTILSKIAQLQA